MAKKIDAWDDLLDEGGRKEVVEQMPKSRLRLFLKPYMWFAIIATPLIVFMAAAALANLRADVLELSSVVEEQGSHASSPGRDVATRAVQEWLEQERPPVPGGEILSWDGSRVIQVTERINDSNQDVTEEAAFRSEVNRFTVIDAYDRLFDVAVQVKVDPRGGAIAVGTPSIMPKTATSNDGWEDGSVWPGIKDDPAVATDAVQTAVQGWVDAYTSGDPARLTVAVGDTDATHLYQPLGGVLSAVADVTAAAPLKLEDPSVIIAQVSIDLTWVGQDPESRQPQPVTLDVLVERADTASPTVVAWGEPGTAPTLTPYQNAVEGRPIEAPASIRPTPETDE